MKVSGKSALGKRGEDEVCTYLEGIGHTILERNYRYGHLEVDVISAADDGIHFVEVKSRTAPVNAAPQDAVDWRKQRNLASAARRYMGHVVSPVLRDKEIWLDVDAVVFDGGETRIEYFPGAVQPLYL